MVSNPTSRGAKSIHSLTIVSYYNNGSILLDHKCVDYASEFIWCLDSGEVLNLDLAGPDRLEKGPIQRAESARSDYKQWAKCCVGNCAGTNLVISISKTLRSSDRSEISLTELQGTGETSATPSIPDVCTASTLSCLKLERQTGLLNSWTISPAVSRVSPL